MDTKTTFKISWETAQGLDFQEVEVDFVQGVFAVHRAAYHDEVTDEFSQSDWEWSVSHITSGMGIQFGFGHQETAIDFCRQFGELITNDDLTDVDGNWQANAYAIRVRDALWWDQPLPLRADFE